ncbi:MAG: carbohydrate binding domain-containing protein, partial [Deltaproteobacteria bacterium]|nr:carbohydrate binding domain-containing protein [Deltaproteobacteria bacterium]
MKSFTIIFFVFLTNIAFTQNLVPNGDFENGSTGWSGGTISADNPHQGKYCMYVKDENKTSNIAASSGLISISQNEYYRFSLWYRSSISGHKILVAINQYDNNGNWISG